MTKKKSIHIAYYALATNTLLDAGQWKYYITSIWGDELHFDDNGGFSLWSNGECVLADFVHSLHAVKVIRADYEVDYEYEYVKDIRS